MNKVGLAVGAVALGILGWWTGQWARGTAVREERSGSKAAPLVEGGTRVGVPPSSAGATPVADRVLSVLDVGRKTFSLTEMAVRLYEETQTMSTTEIRSAIADFAQSQDSYAPSGALYLIGLWAERDLDSARNWLEGVSDTNWTDYAAVLCSSWSRMDPAGMLRWFKSLPDAKKAKLAGKISGELAIVMGKADPAAGLTLLKSLPVTAQADDDFRALFSTWAAAAPSDAARVALELPAGGQRSAAVEAVARAWAQSNGDAARAWAETLPDAALVGRAQAAVATGWAAKDPRAAAQYVVELPPSKPNLAALDGIADRWVRQDAKAALAWADVLTNPELRGGLQGKMLELLATTDPKGAVDAYASRAATLGEYAGTTAATIAQAAFGLGGMDGVQQFAARLPEEQRQRAIASGVSAWMQTAPDAVEGWAFRQPEGEARSTALRQLAQAKYYSEPQKALAWVERLPSSPSSDEALTAIASSTFREDPQRSAALFQRVTNREAIEDNVTWLALWWIRRDPGPAQNWIDSTALLSPDAKTRVRETSLRMNAERSTTR